MQISLSRVAQSVRGVEYTNCISVEDTKQSDGEALMKLEL